MSSSPVPKKRSFDAATATTPQASQQLVQVIIHETGDEWSDTHIKWMHADELTPEREARITGDAEEDDDKEELATLLGIDMGQDAEEGEDRIPWVKHVRFGVHKRPKTIEHAATIVKTLCVLFEHEY